jgi:Nif-specific regulatory protein
VRSNIASFNENLIESELFGHVKGAFTGAIQSKKGLFEEADGGTLFLDEIGEMSANIQVHLLRVLEEKEFTRVGGNELIKVDVRVISATNRDIIAAIGQEQFREDLYHRLNVVQFVAPPLRERGHDILLLAEHFLRQFSAAMNKSVRGIDSLARQKLLGHHWPGNQADSDEHRWCLPRAD